MPEVGIAASNTTATVYTAATEVVAATVQEVAAASLDDNGQGNTIHGLVAFTAGATAGTVVARVRQGFNTLTGPVVATINLSNTVISTPYAAAILAFDPAPPDIGVSGQGLPAYTITLTVAGSNGTGSYACIEVTQLAENS